ncbi:ANR family transcriptional regulator [Serratia fonticola]|uniref:ANR family transcriptional regulator n=1 Tax=Serratia fonticola TaxID=47917 RepID=UPI0013787DA3|nr:ANR family transcriptional regulator [Serratia fonticola]NBJ34752.1 ANR family transcriptional regulator [Serratia fonticola]
MKLSPYTLNANQAAKFEKAGQLQLAATFWRQASAVAVKPVNRDWADVRADRCDKRRTLNARSDAWEQKTKERQQRAEATKANKRLAEALGSHINKTTSGETA